MAEDFPAAHSMDCTWFAVDTDGHVAIFHTNETGALPETAERNYSGVSGILDLLSGANLPFDANSTDAQLSADDLENMGDSELIWDCIIQSSPDESALAELQQVPDRYDPSKRACAMFVCPSGRLFYSSVISAELVKGLHRRGMLNRIWIYEDFSYNRLGIFEYECEGSGGGEPYLRKSLPPKALQVHDLEREQADRFARINFNSVRFFESERIRPRNFYTCVDWDNTYEGLPETAPDRRHEVPPSKYTQRPARGDFDYTGDVNLTALPDEMEAYQINVSGCINLRHLPASVKCEYFYADWSGVQEVPAGMQITGSLSLWGCKDLRYVAEGLTVPHLNVSDCTSLQELPPVSCNRLEAARSGLVRISAGAHISSSLDVSGCLSLSSLPEQIGLHDGHEVNVSHCPALRTLPANLTCERLVAYRSGLTRIPPISIGSIIDLREARSLIHLPPRLKADRLYLSGCSALKTLPEDLSLYVLDISDCTALSEWPRNGTVKGRLIARNCTGLSNLPLWLNDLYELDLGGCSGISELPDRLVVRERLDLGRTRISALPPGCAGAQLYWMGVRVDERIVFQPETITVEEILDEINSERRRVLLERMGFSRFMSLSDAKVVDRDTDLRGGERKLLRVSFSTDGDDEDLVCLSVICPSTGRTYLLRVPPAMQSCHDHSFDTSLELGWNKQETEFDSFGTSPIPNRR